MLPTKITFNGKHVIFYLLFVSFLPITTLFAQTTKITGRVLDAITKEPMPFVSVTFKNTKIFTTSDFDGNYVIAATVPVDSISFSFVGYVKASKKVKQGATQIIDIALKQDEKILDEVVIVSGDNPAHAILNKVIVNKNYNDRTRLNAYQYSLYNKIEFDLNDIPPDLKNKKALKPVKFIFDYVDSSNVAEKPSLPLFISETVSNYYYQKNPKYKKEVITASKMSGTEDRNISQFMGDMYQNVNIYDDNIPVFGRDFASPISNNGLFYYRYYLIDSLFIDNYWCYQLRFKPKRKQELLFDGNMWIADSSFGIKRIEMGIAGDANINYVNTLNVVQEYTKVDSSWMLSKDRLVIDFKLQKNKGGFYGRKTTTYRDHVLNKPMDESFYSKLENLIIAEDAYDKTDNFWTQNRPDSLSIKEKQIYKMVDTIRSLPIYRTWSEIILTVATGYINVGNIDIGPYFNTISLNQFEGLRLRIGAKTSSTFSRWWQPSGYIAYGTKDRQLKYGFGLKLFLTKNPRQLIHVNYKNDYEILGQAQYSVSNDNILVSFLRRNPLKSLTAIKHYQLGYELELMKGVSTRFDFLNRNIHSLTGNYQYIPEGSTNLEEKENINTSEIKLGLRIAWDEKYIEGVFDRSSTGSKFPVIRAEYTHSLKGVLNNDYNYRKVYINIDDRIHLNPIGYTNYIIEAGKMWGTAAYPLLFLPPGNETYILDKTAYNLMNYNEFAIDQFVSLSLNHHFDGFFLNKIPLIRKLKLREVFTIKMILGKVSLANQNTLIFPAEMHTFNKKPYYELGAGLENILKIFTVDAFWRMTYRDAPNISIFGLRLGIQLIF